MKPLAWCGVFLLIWQALQTSCIAKNNIKSEKRGGRNTAGNFVEEQISKGKKSNRLINEKSPYLLQHAFTPVNWFPWGEEAFEKARRESKPIFLSIGYSTCHWCHVMAHESFENPEIAEILNRYFVSVKIDREERPDLDQVYMAVTQAMTGSGGWPMTLFLTPDLKPFFAGTYFPPESRYGRPGFADLLVSVQKAWLKDPGDIAARGDEIIARLGELTSKSFPSGELKAEALDSAAQDFKRIFDSANGGFGESPKFPRPVSLSFLLRQYDRTKDTEILDMVLKTLDAMADGGVYDHVGGGFHRYSVDESWRVPHFEKMLYDQAQLAVAYIEAFQITAKARYGEVARDVLDYVVLEMQDRLGGYYSALDADSALPEDPLRHGEGAFYLWSKKEIASVLTKEEAEVFCFVYGVRKDGNAYVDPQKEFAGKNILYRAATFEEAAVKSQKDEEYVGRLISSALSKLAKFREARPHPHLDDKVLASWNGLMISAMAKGYQVFRDVKYLRSAESAASFALKMLYDKEKGVLHHRYRDGDVGAAGNLEDYAFLAQGFLDLYEASFDHAWVRSAEELLSLQKSLFTDRENGGFFDTTGQDKTVLLRLKTDYDGAEPSGNSVSALNFLRLGRMLDRDDLTEVADKTVSAFAKNVQKIPMGMPHMLSAAAFQMSKSSQIVIVGRRGEPSAEKMIEAVFDYFLPNKVVYFSEGPNSQWGSPYFSFLADMTMLNEKATAYVCLDFTCQRPTDDVSLLREALRLASSGLR